MLNPTTTKIVSRVSEGVAIDLETAILPAVRLPLVTANCHKVIKEQDASLRAAQQDVLVKSLVITELDGVITSLEADFREECAKRIKHEMTIEEMDNEISSQEDENARLHEEIDRHLETIEELTGEHADAVSNVQSLVPRLEALEADMAGTLKALEDARKAAVILLDIADTASKDADKHMDNARDLSQLLDDSGKREDRMHETLMGIRALAESNALTDAEKVALILRLA